jgi:hypothetical protein
MHYLVKTVVAHMRNIELTEMELMALFGMFIWNDCMEWTINITKSCIFRTFF